MSASPDEQPGGSSQGLEPEVAATLRSIIFGLAAEEEAAAASEAAQVPYWCSCPESVIGHRAAAKALRLAAESIHLPFALPA